MGDVPPAASRVTSTVPSVPEGLVAVICVPLSLSTGTEADPNITAVTPLRFAPEIVTVVPPPSGPDGGETPVTVGWAPLSVNVRT